MAERIDGHEATFACSTDLAVDLVMDIRSDVTGERGDKD